MKLWRTFKIDTIFQLAYCGPKKETSLLKTQGKWIIEEKGIIYSLKV